MRLAVLALIVTLAGCTTPRPELARTTPKPQATDDWFWTFDDWDDQAPDPPAQVRQETPVEAWTEADEPADWSDDEWTADDDFSNWNENPNELTRELRELPPGKAR